jgi:hypothetical protein
MNWQYPEIDSHTEEFNYICSAFPWQEEQPQANCFINALPLINVYHGKLRRKTGPSLPSMIELGSSGTACSVYSILFEKYFNYNCINICTDTRQHLLDDVKISWKNRHLVNAKLYTCYNGKFIDCAAQETLGDGISRLRISTLMKENNLLQLDILHSDIQGSEVSVLEELIEDNIIKQIRFFFISTHWIHDLQRSTHSECLRLLDNNLQLKYHFSDPSKGGIGDGLIVAENLEYK